MGGCASGLSEPSQVRPLRLTPQQIAVLQQRGVLEWIPDQQIQKATARNTTTPANTAKTVTAPRNVSRVVVPKRVQRRQVNGNDLFQGLDFALNLTNTSTVRKKGKSIASILMDAGDWL